MSAAAALAILLVVAVAAALHRPAGASPPAAFDWLHASAVPAHWNTAVTPSGAKLAYPPGWRTIASDSGTVSAAPRGPRGAFRGYLNATPLTGAETLQNWSRFRVAHLAGEGDGDVRLAAAATSLRFRAGRGSCVIDTYLTSAAHFREIACIVSGVRATTVVVAAAPSDRWSEQAPLLERAVASFAT
jgi:hypothetical protein